MNSYNIMDKIHDGDNTIIIWKTPDGFKVGKFKEGKLIGRVQLHEDIFKASDAAGRMKERHKRLRGFI
jgi:hypothetical protein